MNLSQAMPWLLIGTLTVGCSSSRVPTSGATLTITSPTGQKSPHVAISSPSVIETPGVVPSKSASPGPRSTSTATPKPEQIEIEETGATKTIDCTGQDVLVGGSENHLVLKGKVGKLTIQGSTNQITVDNVSTVDISGVENKVGYRGPLPKIKNPGNENTVQAATESVSLEPPTPTPAIP